MQKIKVLFTGILFFCNMSLFGKSLQADSLMPYARNQYSQQGEDGIVQEIFHRLKIHKGFFVEFGAADGLWYSNTRALFEKGWSGVFIETDPSQFSRLTKNYSKWKNILCLKETVSWNDTQGRTIDIIAQEFFPNREIDFMSIDVDGTDHLILENIKLKPKVLCIEGGFSWNPQFSTRIPDHIAAQNLQQPLAVMIEIAKKQGYEPVCFTQNIFFIRKDLYGPFKAIQNDPVSLWKEGWNALPKDTRNWLIDFRSQNTNVREMEGPEFLNLNFSTSTQVFTSIYEKGVWGKDSQGRGVSGDGSDPKNVRPYKEFLESFLKEFSIQSVVDLGCGDWQFSKDISWNGIQYTGIDVVESVVRENINKFANKHINFTQMDATQEALPSADLLICKEVLQHLPFIDIYRIINQFKKFKYCLVTEEIGNSSQNKDIQRGSTHHLDLTAPPFNLKAAKVLIYEGPAWKKQVLLIQNE